MICWRGSIMNWILSTATFYTLKSMRIGRPGLRFGRKPFAGKILDHKIRLKTVGRTHLGLGVGNKVVYDAPLPAVPLKAVSRGCEVASVEQHPD